jgi:hypothetical protein
MTSSRVASLCVATGLVAGLGFVAVAGAAGPEPGVNVTVTNTPSQPVPVTLQGTGSFTGNVNVTNTPTVVVDGPVDTLAADKTTALADQFVLITDLIPANNPIVGPLDVSSAKTIRVQVSRSSCTGCGPMLVEVLSGSFPLEILELPGGVGGTSPFATRVYDVPGTSLRLRFANAVAGQSNSLLVRVFARAN